MAKIADCDKMQKFRCINIRGASINLLARIDSLVQAKQAKEVDALWKMQQEAEGIVAISENLRSADG